MSTITSPRPALGVSIPSSARSSLSIDRGTPTNSRRNRAALRDYYNLQASATNEDAETPTQATQDNRDLHVEASELDASDFDPTNYVYTTLARSSLTEVLQAEAGLVSAIRGLDGERKALVYDNYSRLIVATDTIARMRTNMDPIAPEVAGRLGPAVDEIVASASELARTLGKTSMPEKAEEKPSTQNANAQTSKQQDTVRWVLATPDRLAQTMRDGKKEEAESQWKEVEELLNQWRTVKGVDVVRSQCLAALEPQ